MAPGNAPGIPGATITNTTKLISLSDTQTKAFSLATLALN